MIDLGHLEVITQLMDAAAQRGLDLHRIRLGDVEVEFKRADAVAPTPNDLTRPYPAFTPPVPEEAFKVASLPASRPQHGIKHSSLWTNGQLPSFLAPLNETK